MQDRLQGAPVWCGFAGGECLQPKMTWLWATRCCLLLSQDSQAGQWGLLRVVFRGEAAFGV